MCSEFSSQILCFQPTLLDRTECSLGHRHMCETGRLRGVATTSSLEQSSLGSRGRESKNY